MFPESALTVQSCIYELWLIIIYPKYAISFRMQLCGYRSIRAQWNYGTAAQEIPNSHNLNINIHYKQ